MLKPALQLAVMLLVVQGARGGAVIDWFNAGGGGGLSQGGTVALGGTIGQPEAGTTTNVNASLLGGFWGAADTALNWLAVISASQPSPSGSNLTFSATLSADADLQPSEGTAQFFAVGAASVWSVNGVPLQTNAISPGGLVTVATLSFTNTLQPGSNTVLLTISDGVYSSITNSFLVFVPFVNSGDLIIANRSYYLGSGEIMRFVPGGASQLLLNTVLKDAYTVALATNGDILVADYQTGHDTNDDGGIFKIDHTSLNVSVVSQAASFATPFGVAVEPDNQILLADLDANVSGTVFRVDPDTGQATVLSTGGSFFWLGGIVVTTNLGAEAIYVTDEGNDSNLPPVVLAIDPVAGTQSTITTGGYLQRPDGLAVDSSGRIIVADSLAKALIMVDISGHQTLLTTNPPFVFPTHVAVDPVSGDYFVTDGTPTPSTALNVSGAGSLWRVNHTTFAINQISLGGFFEQPRGIIVQR